MVRNTLRVLVCGGRDYGDVWGPKGDFGHPENAKTMHEYTHVHRVLKKLSLEWPRRPEDQYGNWLPDVTIITGSAAGVDRAAYDWAVVNWCRYEEYKPDWDKQGKAAGPIRNKRMLDEGRPDLVVAFPGGKGTAHMVKIAKDAGVPVIQIEREKENNEQQ